MSLGFVQSVPFSAPTCQLIVLGAGVLWRSLAYQIIGLILWGSDWGDVVGWDLVWPICTDLHFAQFVCLFFFCFYAVSCLCFCRLPSKQDCIKGNMKFVSICFQYCSLSMHTTVCATFNRVERSTLSQCPIAAPEAAYSSSVKLSATGFVAR